ncbi:MAG: tRNA1(Val) (adenine(37)-N6)-methyltransferase [Candidatus Aminicenantia bacterium]
MDEELIIGEDETLDRFFRGRVQIIQKKKGWRFSIDAPLLASYIQSTPESELLELGAGNGVVSILVAVSKPFKRIVALEIQDSLISLAKRNVLINSLRGKIEVVKGDIKSADSLPKFDIVFSNPPYRRKWDGRISPNQERAIAKHEILCELKDVLKAFASSMRSEGKGYVIYRTERLTEFEEKCGEENLWIRRLRYVHTKKISSPQLFLCELRLEKGERIEEPPLIIFEDDKIYTKEMEEILSGDYEKEID